MGLRLPGTPYDGNTGPICDDPSSHYRKICMCNRMKLEEYVESYADSTDQDAEPVGVEYRGPLFHDHDSEIDVFEKPEQDAWEEIEYCLAF